MIIFNGLYFRGNWSIPFALGSQEPEGISFYVSNDEKKQTTMMYSQGEYDIGELTDLDSMAIELPYQVIILAK
jgi:serine protease inhibitor